LLLLLLLLVHIFSAFSRTAAKERVSHVVVFRLSFRCVPSQEVDLLYTRAVDHFKDSSLIRVFAAQYYNIYRGNHRIEQIYLTEAEVRSHRRFSCAPPLAFFLLSGSAVRCNTPRQTMHPAFDIVFIAFQRLHQLRQVRFAHVPLFFLLRGSSFDFSMFSGDLRREPLEVTTRPAS
jgi:hypothetical protein